MEETRPMIEEAHRIDHESEGNSSSVTCVVFRSTIVSLCGSLCIGCVAGYSSAAQAGIMTDLDLSEADYSLFSTTLTIGGMIGALMSGKIADLIGRRATMWSSSILCTAAWILMALGQNALWIDIGRLLLGIGCAILSYVIPVYIAEISTEDIRGTLTSLNTLISVFGISLMYIVGNVVGWRTLALIGAIPALLQILGLFFTPESPRWLAKVGKKRELEAVLQRLRGKNADIYEEAAEIIDYTERFQQQQGSLIDLFQWRYAHVLTVAIGLMAFQQFGGSGGLVSYTSSIFTKAGFSSSVGTISVAIVKIPAILWCVLVADKLGRRPILMISAAGTCLGCFLLGLSFLFMGLKYLDHFTPILAYLAVVGYLAAFSIGLAGSWIIVSEIFPISVKGSAGSLVTFTYNLCSALVTYNFNFMLQWSSSGTFFIFAAICGTTVIFVAKLVPETKGRKLEELQASLTNFVP